MRDTYQFYDNAMITAGLNDAESSRYLKKLFSAGMTWPGGLERNFSKEISKNKEIDRTCLMHVGCFPSQISEKESGNTTVHV